MGGQVGGRCPCSRLGVPSTPQYEPIVTKGNEALVHHMEVFQCTAGFKSSPHLSGPCDSKMKAERDDCRHVLAAWALGAKVHPWGFRGELGSPPHLCPHFERPHDGGCQEGPPSRPPMALCCLHPAPWSRWTFPAFATFPQKCKSPRAVLCVVLISIRLDAGGKGGRRGLH